MQAIIVDSNIVIYSVLEKHEPLRQFMRKYETRVSEISKIEVLGFHNLTIRDKANFELFFDKTLLYPVDSVIVNHAIALKQQKKMSLGDSIIASTALLYGLPLMTRNVADFAWINGLHLINPFND